jgi:mRNA interferase MazF
VLSPRRYNDPAGLCVVCPITSQQKEYPFEVPLPVEGTITGVILADHIKSLSWEHRNAAFAGKASAGSVAEVKAKFAALLQIG